MTGCVTKGWEGLLPGKDVEITNPKRTFSCPWFTDTMSADRVATRVAPTANPLPPIPSNTLVTNAGAINPPIIQFTK